MLSNERNNIGDEKGMNFPKVLHQAKEEEKMKEYICEICRMDPRIKFEINNTESKILKCNFCKHEFIDKKPTQRELTKYYNKNVFSSMHYYLENIKEEEKMFLNRFLKIKNEIPRRGTLLDVGCNIGIWAEIFHKEKWEVHALDLNKGAIDYLANRPFNSFHSSLEEFKTSKRFDLISMNDVIEHFRNLEKVMSVIDKLLKKGGYLFLSTPRVDAFLARISNKKWLHYKPFEHLRYFSQVSLFLFLAKNDFHIIKIFKVTRYRNLHTILDKMETYGDFFQKINLGIFKQINLKLTLGDEICVLAKK